MVVHAFDTNTQEAEAGKCLSSWLALSTHKVPCQSKIHGKTLSTNKQINRTKQKTKEGTQESVNPWDGGACNSSYLVHGQRQGYKKLNSKGGKGLDVI